MTKLFAELNKNQPHVMGVLNVTPDSFSDGNRYFVGNKVSVSLCMQHAENMIKQGASIIDVGGESTRPKAIAISSTEELDRVMPVLEALRHLDCVVSLDTSNPELMQQANKVGVGLINDVRALQREGALNAAAESGLPVCLMHMQGDPSTMQNAPYYADIMRDIADFFRARIVACEKVGISRDRMVLDPGFGFGKTLIHNQHLLYRLQHLEILDLPLLVGLSRKSMIGQMLNDCDVNNRLLGSVTLAVMAYERGAWIVRAHDVKATVEALTIAHKIMRSSDE